MALPAFQRFGGNTAYVEGSDPYQLFGGRSPQFDAGAFHAEVLDSGALPMTVLESKINGWIAASRR